MDLDARLSKKALIGAAWLTWIPLLGMCFVIAVSNQQDDAIELPMMALAALCALPAAAAPFVTTILGWIAVGDIRRSGGRLNGLPLAVFDGLFFPLFFVDWVLFVLAAGIGVVVTKMGFMILDGLRPEETVALLAFPVGLVASVLVDLIIVRAVWKRVRLPRATEVASLGDTSWSGIRRHEEVSFLRRHRELFAAGVAIGVAALLISWKVARDGGFGHAAVAPAQITSIASPAPYHPSPSMTAESEVSTEDANRRWRFGPAGPEISPVWASGVGLNAEQRTQIDGVLQSTYADYQRLIEAHTSAERKGAGVSFTIAAFPDDFESLADRFWTEVDPMLTRDQQAMMRYNFPLRFDPRRSGYPTNDNVTEKIMLFGAERSTVSIERTGLWFRWSISGPIGWSSTTPELPLALHGWEQRFDRVIASVHDGGTAALSRVPVIAPKPSDR